MMAQTSIRERVTRLWFAVLTVALVAFTLVSFQDGLCEGDRCGETLVNDDDVGVLKNATALIERERGDTNQPSPEWLAFQKFLAIGKLGRDAITELLQKATPAGRLYAVILLKGLDQVESTKVLNRMTTQSDKVLYIRGCSVETTTVGALAKRIIKGEKLVVLSTLPGGIAMVKEDPWDDETGGHDKVCARSGIAKGTLVAREMLINHNGGDYAAGPNGPYHEKFWVIGRTAVRNIAKGSTINGGMLGPMTAGQLARQKSENAADLSRLRSQVAEAIDRYQRALQAEKIKNGEGSPQALILQQQIASSFLVLENWAESKRYYKQLQANARASKSVDETSKSILLRECEEQLSRLQCSATIIIAAWRQRELPLDCRRVSLRPKSWIAHQAR